VGHQINFYISPKEMEQRLRNLGPLAIIHSRSASASPRILTSLDVEEEGRPWLFLFLARPEDLRGVVLKNVPSQGYWIVDVLRSPAIEFTRCFFDGRILRRGRAYWVDGFYGDDQSWVDKGSAFKSWAASARSAIKKHLKRHGTDYIGRDALSWLNSSGGQLVQ
jgi:hypothetical protein